MAKPKLFVSRDVGEEARIRLSRQFDLDVFEGEDKPSRSEMLERTEGKDGLLSLLTDPIDEVFFEARPNIRIVAQMAVGFNNIDVSSATRHGVVVTNTPGVLTETTAELAFALVLAASRRIVEADDYVRRGEWKVEWHPRMLIGQDVRGSTFGILGLGRIGKHVAILASAFGASVIYHDVVRKEECEKKHGWTFVSLDELFATSDFLSVHVNLSDGTRAMVDEAAFDKMKPNCIFVNTSRGAVVSQRALLGALRTKSIAAAGLDVFGREPLDKESLEAFKGLTNVVLAPHIGSASLGTRNRMAELSVESLEAFFNGKPVPNVVNPEVLKPL